MQGSVNLAVLLAFFVNTKPANKAFQNFTKTDWCTLIEQSGNYTNWQVALKFITLYCLKWRKIGTQVTAT